MTKTVNGNLEKNVRKPLCVRYFTISNKKKSVNMQKTTYLLFLIEIKITKQDQHLDIKFKTWLANSIYIRRTKH